MFVALTTVADRADADRIAAAAIEHNLAVCVQVDGPVLSHYRWQERIEKSEEFRLTFKCVSSHLAALEAQVLALHPYETPEWLVFRAEHVGEKYLSWAEANSSTRPFNA